MTRQLQIVFTNSAVRPQAAQPVTDVKQPVVVERGAAATVAAAGLPYRYAYSLSDLGLG